MRLRSLELSDFRKFDRPVRLEGLADGINVLAEPNEFGKSTLLAAIKAVLFERHRARSETVRRMQHHRNGTFPVVRMGFELADGLHQVEKRFLHREPYARLTLPDGTWVEGDAAEERLQALLGFGAAGTRGANAETLGLWGALWVEQQEAVQQPALAEAGRVTLHACLEAELGTLSGDDRSGAIRREVEAERSGLLDGNGKPRGRYRQAAEELASTEAELVSLRGKRTALEDAIAELARLRRVLAQASDPEAEARIVADLLDARKRRDVVLGHRDRLHQAVTALQLAERHRAEAMAERERRATRAADLATAERALTDAIQAEALAARELAETEAALASRRDAVQAAQAEADAASQGLRKAEAVLSLALRSERVGHLGRQLQRAGKAQDAVNQLTGELAALPADAARLQAVEAAQAVLERARSVLGAQATEIELDLLPEADARVQVDGAAVSPGQTVLRVVTDTTVEIAGVGRLRVRPAIRDRTVLQKKVTIADAGLRDALAEIGAVDLADAQVRAAARRGLEDRLRAAEATLAAEAPGDEAIGLRPGLEALRNHFGSERSRLEAEMTALEMQALPTGTEAEAALLAGRQAEAVAVGASGAARTALAGPQASRDRAVRAQAASAAAASEARNAMVRLQRDAEAAVAVEGDAALADRLAVTETEWMAQQALVAQVRREQPADTLEGMDARIERLEQARKAQSETLRRLREDIVKLDTQIVQQEGDGLDEQIEMAERRRDDLTAEHGALTRDAAVLTLLRDALMEAERAARERYVAPVLRRMTPYLQRLFPGVEVALDENLRITGLTRQAGVEDIDRLSDGTREQVAVLLRLAYADLLRDQGRPAMLILDDALAYSDRDRLELMFDMLTQASARLQVLVLTCRAEAFGRLGGSRVRLVTA